MDEHVEFKRQCDTLVQIAGKELSPVCSEDERWILAEKRIMKMARNGGPNAMRCLLGLLRKPDLPDQVADVVAKAMALCCGPCAAPPAVRTFIFSPSLTVQVNEIDYAQGGLGWKVWGAGLILSWRLLALKDMIRGKEILELGSGCGLCGLILANLGASKVVLTDNISDILFNLSRNISLLTLNCQSKLEPDREIHHEKLGYNQEQLIVKNLTDCIYEKNTPEEDPCPCLIRVRMLDWMEDSALASDNSSIEIQVPSVFPGVAVDEKFDWIVGSDLLYDLKSSFALAGVIRRRLLNSNSRALIVNPIREKDLLEQFLKEVNRLGLTTNVEQVDQQEWTNCKLATYGEDGDDDLDEYCTMYNMEHYEGGIVALYITLKN
jgi:predicted nicotinamide N-methyase